MHRPSSRVKHGARPLALHPGDSYKDGWFYTNQCCHMIISCPKCGARFQVDPDKLGAEGRQVRCGKCGDKWHQAPPGSGIEPAVDIEPDEARALFGAAQADSAGGLDSDVPDTLFDKLSASLTDRPEAEAAESEAPEVDAALESPPEAPPVADVPRAEARDSGSWTAEAKPQSAPLAAEPSATKAASGRVGYVEDHRSPVPFIAGSLVIVMLILGSVAIEARGWVTLQVPALSVVYQQLGLNTQLGQGLELRDVVSERRMVEGIDSLVVVGQILNTSDRERHVPLVQARLKGMDDEPVRQSNVDPGSDTLSPGETTDFEVTLARPPTAGQLMLDFAPRP